MSSPDYRAVLQRLMNAVHDLRLEAGNSDLRDVLNDSRAMLAAPEVVGVSDEDLFNTYHQAKAADKQQQGTLAGLRAVLARYGTPAPVPIALTERQPQLNDCNPERECWTTHYNPKFCYSPVWNLTELPKKELGHDFHNAFFWRTVTHWLPHWAILLPATSSGGKP